MKRFGTVSYNIYCNFTNYGSAMQTWALHGAIKKFAGDFCTPVLVDYCPDILKKMNPLNPFANMWDKDEESRRLCEMLLPAIRINYEKFDRFYHERFERTAKAYTAENYNDIMDSENLDGFVCGSDTIFCPDEFGIDDGYYANYDCMRGHSVAYAASFGDPHFTDETYPILNDRLQNFLAFGLREEKMIPYVTAHTSAPVKKVVDPTLLLTAEDYDTICADRQESEKYLLLYSRRYNPKMEAYAERLAAENGWKIVEISLRANNAEKPNRRMFYDAGVEEFLSLVKHAEFVVTNSFHGMIFSVQYSRPFYVFSREQCDTKITELLDLFGLSDRMKTTGDEAEARPIDYDDVHARIAKARLKSAEFLKAELALLTAVE